MGKKNEIKAKWIHPIGVAIDGNRISKDPPLSSVWNAATTSLEYLLLEDSGCIKFQVPENVASQFIVGFSQGDIRTGFADCPLAVSLQQRGSSENNQMALNLFMYGIQLEPKGDGLTPGTDITICYEEDIITVAWAERKHSVSFSQLEDGLTAKVCLKTQRSSISNIKLTGEWRR